MSFKAKLSVGGKDLNVVKCSYELIQEVDNTGRPSSVTKGGQIHLTVESTGDAFLWEWGCSNFDRKDGTITFLKRDSDAKLKEIKFKEAYLVNYKEVFDAFDNNPMYETIVISAHEIETGGGSVKNEWPTN